MFQLYGSQTSPFVRRLRLLLDPKEYVFVPIDIFAQDARAKFLKISPLLKLPVLEIGGQAIWDSRVIFNQLCARGYHRPLTLGEENFLTAISDVSDSLVQTLLAKRSGVTFPVGTPLEISHRERIENTFGYLDQAAGEGAFAQWNFLGMSLYALLDWVEFRNLAPLDSYRHLKSCLEKNRDRPRIPESDPRLTH
jgi:glutathione S-transferase